MGDSRWIFPGGLTIFINRDWMCCSYRVLVQKETITQGICDVDLRSSKRMCKQAVGMVVKQSNEALS